MPQQLSRPWCLLLVQRSQQLGFPVDMAYTLRVNLANLCVYVSKYSDVDCLPTNGSLVASAALLPE
jgi:hypothetical protein